MDRIALLVQRVLQAIGLDRATLYGVLTRFWTLFARAVTVIAIGRFLTEDQQGYYFTMNSLLAIQVFFELGLTNVVSIFASHEFVHLTWGEQGEITGDEHARERLVDLLAKTTKWFAVAAGLLLLFLIAFGLFFFSIHHHGAAVHSWRLPWCLAAASTALFLASISFYAILIGSGNVAEANHVWFWAGVSGSVLCWVILGTGWGLYAVCATNLSNGIVSWLHVFRTKPKLLSLTWRQLRHRGLSTGAPLISWRYEIWPLQWKMAVSWISGYFIFSLFTPVLFYYQGPVEAGRMGMTFAAANAILGIGLTWAATRAPEMAKLVAVRKWAELDALFLRTAWQATLVAAAGAACGFAIIRYLQLRGISLGNRFLPARLVAAFFAAIVLTVIIGVIGTYLRSHKDEPLMVVAAIGAVIQGAATLYTGMRYSGEGVCYSFLLISITYQLPAAAWVCIRYRRRQREQSSLPLTVQVSG